MGHDISVMYPSCLVTGSIIIQTPISRVIAAEDISWSQCSYGALVCP
jgi:hypothetical protein